MPVIIIVVVGVVLVVALVLVVVSARRSRSARTDWLGELSDIRMSSLGDDDEVTGALEAVNVDDEDEAPGDGEAESVEAGTSANVEGAVSEPAAQASDDGARTDEEEAERSASPADVGDGDLGDDETAAAAPGQVEAPGPDDASLRSGEAVADLEPVTDRPDRTFSEGGTVFNEYHRPDGARIRVEATDPDGLRVLVPTADAATATCGVDLPRGVLWHLAADGAVAEACSIRTPSGWVTTTGTLLVLVDGTGWTYAMCLDGVATVERRADGAQHRLDAGEIGRGKVGSNGFEIARVGVDALESEGAVRRQRRLDQTAR